MSSLPSLHIAIDAQRIKVSIAGSWSLEYFETLRRICSETLKANSKLRDAITSNSKIVLEIDAANLINIDTSGAKALSNLINFQYFNANQEIILSNFTSENRKLLELVVERLDKFAKSSDTDKAINSTLISKIGQTTYLSINYLIEIFSFLGLVTEAILKVIRNPKLFRPKETVTQIEESCLKSIPVVCLVTFLIGVVVAYLMAIQVQKYGGNIFVVNGVALAMCRELSPIIVAIVMAGRSGSAYTAQIGAMRMNEEVDAITTLGLSPLNVLVLPRLLALTLSMPLLVFIGDIVGMWGGMLISEVYLGISYTTFIDRLHTALPIKHFVVGMIKAPVFAAVIALIGCRRGLHTEMNARSVGLSTTATVVESIVLVILINAGFAVIFSDLGL